MARVDVRLAQGRRRTARSSETLTHGIGLMCARELEAIDTPFLRRDRRHVGGSPANDQQAARIAFDAGSPVSDRNGSNTCCTPASYKAGYSLRALTSLEYDPLQMKAATSGIFDTSNGNLVLPSGVTLRSGISLGEVTGLGISFVRTTPDRTGFIWRSIEPCVVGTKRIYFSLGFDTDRLAKVEFGFSSPPNEMPAQEKRREHDQFLAAELGKPNHTDIAKTVYKYPWGRISSYYDPRSDNAMIILSWA